MASPEHECNKNQYVQEIDYNEIEKLETVGEGSFGVVYRGIWRETYVAVKNIVSQNEKEAFKVEVRQLSRVNHENIVKLYGACTKGPSICLVMEYAEGGSLFNVLHHAPKVHYTMAHCMSWMHQCAKGVAYLHGMKPKPLIHRDLKPPNLLLIKDFTWLKICDFGTAVDKTAIMTNNKGSAAWMAPEVFSTSNYTEKCDVFSWGIILWEVLSRLKPFFHINSPSAYRILWAKHNGSRPPLVRNCPRPIESLMTLCWDKDALRRPSMEEIATKMEFICSLLPGADEPIEIGDGEDEDESVYDEEDEDGMEDEEDMDQTVADEIDQFPMSTNGENGVRTLPQPTSDMGLLHLDIDPNSWEEVESDDMQLRTMPGFDKMVPKNGSKNTVEAGIQSTTSTTGSGSNGTDADLDAMYLLLDTPLRPATPDRNDPKSMALFEEHKREAQEYLKVQTEQVLVARRKQELLAAQTEDQDRRMRQMKIVRDLQSEKESLMMLRDLLQKQKESQVAANNSQQQANNRNNQNDWEVIPRQNDHSPT